METAAAQQPVIINSGGGSGTTKIIGGVLIAGAVIYFGKQYLDQRNKNASEKELDTPAGAIALQFKTLFEDFNVSAEAYKRIALQMTPDLKDEVYRLYRLSTGRNLSDDIANKIQSAAQNTVAKQEKINATSNATAAGIIKITPDDKIQFLVTTGSIVRFEPGSKTPIPLYKDPLSIAIGGPPAYMLPPTALQFKVHAVKEVPFEGTKQAEGWQKYFRPYVRTRKVFAAVQIILPMTNTKTGAKTYITLWGDARSFRQGKGTSYLKGLDCQCKHNLGLVA